MQIAVFELEEWERESFAQLGESHPLKMSHEPLSRVNAPDYADVEAVSIFIYSDLSRVVLEQLPNLKLIATRSTGFDHIDLAYCKEQGITVCNVPYYGANTVVEHTFGLLLTISHKLDQAVDRTRKGDFSFKGLQGFDLFGKTLGVLGTGEIGLWVIHIAKGFGMNVLAYDVKPKHEKAKEMGFTYASLDEVYAQADIITLHVPSNEATHHMLNEEAFTKMKHGVVLINTARGAVIHMRSLMRALAEGKVAAAGLDVLPEEPTIREEAELLRTFFQEHHDLENLLADHVILRLRNVIVTPHSAFNTREAVQRILDTTVENVEGYLKGEPLNVVS